jgi:hypothetical protein
MPAQKPTTSPKWTQTHWRLWKGYVLLPLADIWVNITLVTKKVSFSRWTCVTTSRSMEWQLIHTLKVMERCTTLGTVLGRICHWPTTLSKFLPHQKVCSVYSIDTIFWKWEPFDLGTSGCDSCFQISQTPLQSPRFLCSSPAVRDSSPPMFTGWWHCFQGIGIEQTNNLLDC